MMGPSILLILRLCCGLLLLWAGGTKLADLAGTREVLGRYQLIPLSLVPVVTVGLPVVEVVTGAVLVSGLVTAAAALVTSVIFAAFTVGVAITLIRGVKAPCGCFGVSPTETTSFITLARSLVLAAMGITIFLGGHEGWSALSIRTAIPSVTIAAGAAILLRFVGLVPQAVAYLRETPVVAPARGHRVSLRNMPLDENILLLEPPPSQPQRADTSATRVALKE